MLTELREILIVLRGTITALRGILIKSREMLM